MCKIAVMLLVSLSWSVFGQKESLCPSSFDFQHSLFRKLVTLETELEITKAKVQELENNMQGMCVYHFLL